MKSRPKTLVFKLSDFEKIDDISNKLCPVSELTNALVCSYQHIPGIDPRSKFSLSRCFGSQPKTLAYRVGKNSTINIPTISDKSWRPTFNFDPKDSATLDKLVIAVQRHPKTISRSQKFDFIILGYNRASPNDPLLNTFIADTYNSYLDTTSTIQGLPFIQGSIHRRESTRIKLSGASILSTRSAPPALKYERPRNLISPEYFDQTTLMRLLIENPVQSHPLSAPGPIYASSLALRIPTSTQQEPTLEEIQANYQSFTQDLISAFKKHCAGDGEKATTIPGLTSNIDLNVLEFMFSLLYNHTDKEIGGLADVLDQAGFDTTVFNAFTSTEYVHVPVGTRCRNSDGTWGATTKPQYIEHSRARITDTSYPFYDDLYTTLTILTNKRKGTDQTRPLAPSSAQAKPDASYPPRRSLYATGVGAGTDYSWFSSTVNRRATTNTLDHPFMVDCAWVRSPDSSTRAPHDINYQRSFRRNLTHLKYSSSAKISADLALEDITSPLADQSPRSTTHHPKYHLSGATTTSVEATTTPNEDTTGRASTNSFSAKETPPPLTKSFCNEEESRRQNSVMLEVISP